MSTTRIAVAAAAAALLTATALTPAVYRFTPFEEKLVPGSPTTYLVDGKPREMQRDEVTVQALKPDGSAPLAGATDVPACGIQTVGTLRYAEAFPTALKKRTQGSDPSITTPQSQPGAVYNSESGFFNQIWRWAGGSGDLFNIYSMFGIAWIMALFEGTVAFVMISASMKSTGRPCSFGSAMTPWTKNTPAAA